MTTIKNPLELYKRLKQSNCRECMLPSCMAFAVAVIQGQKKLADCPYIDPALLGPDGGVVATRRSFEDEQRELLESLKRETAAIDVAAVAGNLGAREVDGRIAVNCLGKDFIVDGSGELKSECHNNLWVHGPLLNYIIHGKGRTPTGEWVSFHELPGAADWSRFFAHRCQESFRLLLNAHTELLLEIIHLFGARSVTGHDADDSLMLLPLPKLPLLINYWRAEGEFPSKLNLLFDVTAADNLKAGFICTLCQGLVEMFRALIVKHNKTGTLFS